jgi:hypothetical protein
MSTTTTEGSIWGIHGGRTGDADTLFLKSNYVALDPSLRFLGVSANDSASGSHVSIQLQSSGRRIKIR